MSEVKVNKLSPRSGTTVTLGDSGDTISVPSGVTLSGDGTITPSDSTVTSAKLSGALVTPSTLDVNGNELILDADADTSITADTDDTIHIKTGGSDRVTVNDTGLGIGNTAPSVSLSVGDDDDGSQGVVGKKALISQTLATVYAGGTSGSWGGLMLNNNDSTSNRTATGLHFTHGTSGVAGLVSTSDTSQRADLRFITRGAGDTVAERMRIDDDGHVICPEGITLGTSVGTYAAANTMDDYEEGTWTPTTNIGYANVYHAFYVKIGRLVFVHMYVQTNAGPGDTSQATSVSGLPFAAASGDIVSNNNIIQGLNQDVYSEIGGSSFSQRDRSDGTAITRSEYGSKYQKVSMTYYTDS